MAKSSLFRKDLGTDIVVYPIAFGVAGIMRVAQAAMLLIILLAMPCCGRGQFEGGTYKPMQEDFDRLRLDHLLVIAQLVEEYERKAGHYPFADREDGKPVAVVIASDSQVVMDNGRAPIMLDLKSRAKNGKIPEPPKKIERLTVQELTQELESVLGRAIDLPVDAQKAPVNKPSV